MAKGEGGRADLSSHVVSRGDVFWANPGGDHGPVPPRAHPHVVVQDDVLNRSRLDTVVVCAITSNAKRANEPGNVLLDDGEGGLERRSVVVVSQVSSVRREELGARIGALSAERVDQILDGLRFQQASFERRAGSASGASARGTTTSMDANDTLARLAAIDIPPLDRAKLPHRAEVEASLAYLASPAAEASLADDPYWPKWDSPWWHLLLLHERGELARVPREHALRIARSLDRMPLKIFPTRTSEVPAGLDPLRDASCHCALGCIVPALLGCGVDVDEVLPWVRPWFGRYQMADGGLTCDFEAYHHPTEVPSSMVGTVAPLEALLALSAVRPRDEDTVVLDRAASFLVGRALVRGSDTTLNADERTSALAWPKATFPRFYFYDVLRGLRALVAWATYRRRAIPWSSVREAVGVLLARHPNGHVTIERRAFEGVGTRLREPDGSWSRGHRESEFALLRASSALGAESPFLTDAFREARAGLLALAHDGLLVLDG